MESMCKSNELSDDSNWYTDELIHASNESINEPMCG